MSHAKLSPSAAHRWLACPGSIRMSEGIEETSSPAAEEGTLAHELGELALLEGVQTDAVAGDYPKEMVDFVQEYVSYVREIAGDRKIKIEHRVDLGEWVPGGYGTADAVIHIDDEVHVIDLKYGMSQVNAKKNLQLMLYGLGCLKKKTKHAVLHICQPRLNHWDSWDISAKKLRQWGKKIKPLAALCLEPDAPLKPSDSACQWCPAAPTCPALHDHALEVVGGDFASLPAVEDLTPEQVARVVLNEKLINTFIGKIKERALEDLEAGEDIPGLKLVESVTRRKYNDKAAEVLPKILGDAAWKEPELVNITTASKLVGKAKFDDLGITVKPQGKPTVAPENDRRKAITKTIEDFDQS